MLYIGMAKYKFKFEPYKHQRTALELSWNRTEFAYFMDMGTGKSKTLIDNVGILYSMGKLTGALIVAPKGVYGNWFSNEIPTHFPDEYEYTCVMWSASTTKKQELMINSLYINDNKLKIFLINVEALSTERGSAAAKRFLVQHVSMMAIDESTTIKNKSAKRTKSIIKLGRVADYRRILTGSPVTKSPMDLYSQCDFLKQGLLGEKSFYAFQTEYGVVERRYVGSHSFNSVVGYRNLHNLSDMLKKFSYRVKKEDCLDLPDKVYVKRDVELNAEQKRVYDELKEHAMALFEDSEITTTTILTQMLRLQQVCTGHVKTDDGEVRVIDSAKLPELMNVLEEVDGKVIIWANFTHDILTVTQALREKYGKESAEDFYGATSTDDRQSIVGRFQDSTSPLQYFVGQPRTGGYGLTLTQAKTVIYYSNNFDLEIRLQSEDRAHRIGQDSKVTYIDIVCKDTVEERILHALRAKIDIATKVMKEDFRKWII